MRTSLLGLCVVGAVGLTACGDRSWGKVANADAMRSAAELSLVAGAGSPADPAFACLESAADVRPVTGHHEKKYRPRAATGRAFDARSADFVVRERWGMIAVEGNRRATGMCWAGGLVRSDKPWNASWADHKDLDGPTRNSAAISNDAYGMVVTGLHFFNVHDGVRTSNAYSWVIQDVWGEYVRDDCIENDHMRSGRVRDVLLDGCYTGISTRPSDADTESDGRGQVVELDRVLLRMQPMPYPFEWQEKSGVIGVDGQPYQDTGIPYGHGNIFKLDNDDITRNPHFRVTNSVFLVTHFTTARKLDFPPEALLDACEGNTLVWLGDGAYPGKLPTSKFPECFTVLTGTQGTDFWVEKVRDWHQRHPGVGFQRKPASPGSLEFPKMFQD